MSRQTARFVGRHVPQHCYWVFLTTWLMACSPITSQVQTHLDEREYKRAIAIAHDWLDQPGNRGDVSRTEVETLLAKARLRLALASRDVAQIAAFRHRYKGRTAFKKLVSKALEKESAIYFRTVAVPRDSVIVYKRFRDTYPGVDLTLEVLRLEVRAAIRDARALKSIDAFRRLQPTYGKMEALKPLLKKARAAEAELAFEIEASQRDDIAAYRAFLSNYSSLVDHPRVLEARKRELALAYADAAGENMLSVLDAFLERYGSWPEASELVAKIRKQRAQRALDVAIETATVEAFDAFRQRHPEIHWQALADEAEVKTMFRPFAYAIRTNQRVPLGVARSFLERYAGHPALRKAVDPLRARLKQRVIDLPDTWSARLFRVTYPDDSAVQEILTAERALAWSNAQRDATVDAFADYVTWYGQTDEGRLAEKRLYELKRSFESLEINEFGTYKGHRGAVYTQVAARSCDGLAVGGLPASAFSTGTGAAYVDARDAKPVRLDVVFALDLSADFIRARRGLIDGLLNLDDRLRAERFSPRYSLVTFGAGAPANMPWSGDVNVIKKAIEDQPMSPMDDKPDTLAGLIKATRLRYRSGALRTLVVLTNKTVGYTAESLAAARIKPPKACKQARAAKQCFKRCTKGNGPRRAKVKCLQACARKTPKVIRAPYAACLKQATLESAPVGRTTLDGQLQCLESIDLVGLESIATCRRPLELDGRILRQLRRQFTRLGIERHFIVPSPLKKEPVLIELARGGFGGVVSYEPSQEAAAQSLDVPLFAFANGFAERFFLSLQKAKKNARQTQGIMGRAPLVWRQHTRTPAGSLVHLHRVITDKGCALEHLVSRRQGMFVRRPCGGLWTPLEQTKSLRPQAAVSSGSVTIILDETDRVMLLSGAQGEMVDATPKGIRMKQLLQVADRIWATGLKHNDELGVWRWRAENSKWSEINLPPEIGGVARPLILPVAGPSTHGLCLQTKPDEIWCRLTQHQGWRRYQSSGLSASAFQTAGPMTTVIGPHLVSMMVDGEGQVWRARAGGRRWEKTPLAAAKGGQIVAAHDRSGTVCLQTAESLSCSENAGLDWSNMKAPGRGVGQLLKVDDALHGVWNGGLYRLERLERAYRMPLRAQSQQNDMFPWRSHYEELVRNAHSGAPELGLIARVEGAQTHHKLIREWLTTATQRQLSTHSVPDMRAVTMPQAKRPQLKLFLTKPLRLRAPLLSRCAVN